MKQVSEEMKTTAMEYWKHINEWATKPPADQEEWQYAKLAVNVVKTFVQQQAVENNREAIKLSTVQFMKDNNIDEMKQILEGQQE